MPLAGNENEEGKIKATYIGMIKDKAYFRDGENLECSHRQHRKSLSQYVGNFTPALK